MDVPEDIRKAAKSLSERLYLTGEYPAPDPQTIIAQALLSERLAQKERDAKIAEEWRSPLRPGTEARLLGHQEAARDIGAAIRQS